MGEIYAYAGRGNHSVHNLEVMVEQLRERNIVLKSERDAAVTRVDQLQEALERKEYTLQNTFNHWQEAMAERDAAVEALRLIGSSGGCLCGFSEWCEACDSKSSYNAVRRLARETLAMIEKGAGVE